MRILILLLISQVLLAKSLPKVIHTEATNWKTTCPLECTCYSSLFGETLLDGEDDTSERLEYLFKEDTPVSESLRSDNGLQAKAVACIISQRTKLRGMFAALPVETQVLTLMQSHDSPNVSLGREHFSHIEGIKSLSIQGAGIHNQLQHGMQRVGNDERRPSLLIEWDAFSPLQGLEIIDMEHVEFEAAPDDVDFLKLSSKKKRKNKKKREATDDDTFLIMDDDMPNKKVFVEEGGPMTIIHELVFLPGEEDSSKIVPYEVYKAEKESQNSLESFFFVKNLRTLRLNHCRIPPLSKNTFAGLDNLRHLSIKNCDVKILPDLLFAKSTNIETLVLAENSIVDLTSASFAGLFELQHLDLSYNDLTHISETSFAPMPSLQFINLRGNSLRIYPSTFEVLNSTRRIYLGDPHDPEVTVDIIPGAFKGLRHLHHLTIHGLRVQHLDSEILRGTKMLNDLVIKGQIHELSFDAFIHHPKLRKLDVSNCQIRHISVDSFQSLYGLQILDLSNNELEELPPGVFDSLQSLKELWLNGNKLQELPEQIFRNLHSKLIRLDENPWHCTCDLKHLNPAVVNKVRSTKHPIVCDKAFDKPSLCHSSHILKYEYDRLVAPRCKTPMRFDHSSVFDVLRKELRCDNRYGVTQPVNTVNMKYLNQLNLKQLRRNFEKYAEAHTEESEEKETVIPTDSEEDADGGELIEDEAFYQPSQEEIFFNLDAGEHPFAHLKVAGTSLVKSKLTMDRKLAPYEMENETILKEDLQAALEQRVDEIVEALQKKYESDNQEEKEENLDRPETGNAKTEPDKESEENEIPVKMTSISDSEAALIPKDTLVAAANDIETVARQNENGQEQEKQVESEVNEIDNEISNEISPLFSPLKFTDNRDIADLKLSNRVEERQRQMTSNLVVAIETKRSLSELLLDPEYTSKLSKKNLKAQMEKAGMYKKKNWNYSYGKL